MAGDISDDNKSDKSLQLIKKLEQDNQELCRQLEYFQEQVLKLQEDLRRKDEQIAEASHRHDTVVMQMNKLVKLAQPMGIATESVCRTYF